MPPIDPLSPSEYTKTAVYFGDNSDKFLHQRRALHNADIYFFSYLGEERFTGMLALTGAGSPEAWDPKTDVDTVSPNFR